MKRNLLLFLSLLVFSSINAQIPEVFVGLEAEVTVNDKGVVRVQKGSNGNCDVFLFRLEDGYYRCIGGKMDRHDYFNYDVSYNFLTGKQIRTDGEGKNKKSSTSVMPQMPVLKYGWFPLDFDMLGYLFEDNDYEGGVDFKTTMGIFRLMQDKDMLAYAFNNYDYPYYPPSVASDGSASIYCEIMVFGRYNIWSNIDLIKQDDGSFLIEVLNEYEDRTYEQYLDEDMENLEEAMQRADDERGGEPAYTVTETFWRFKDGKFTKISKETEEE